MEQVSRFVFVHSHRCCALVVGLSLYASVSSWFFFTLFERMFYGSISVLSDYTCNDEFSAFGGHLAWAQIRIWAQCLWLSNLCCWRHHYLWPHTFIHSFFALLSIDLYFLQTVSDVNVFGVLFSRSLCAVVDGKSLRLNGGKKCVFLFWKTILFRIGAIHRHFTSIEIMASKYEIYSIAICVTNSHRKQNMGRISVWHQKSNALNVRGSMKFLQKLK